MLDDFDEPESKAQTQPQQVKSMLDDFESSEPPKIPTQSVKNGDGDDQGHKDSRKKESADKKDDDSKKKEQEKKDGSSQKQPPKAAHNEAASIMDSFDF